VGFCRFLLCLFLSALDYIFCIRIAGKSTSHMARARWLERWAGVHSRIVGLEVEYRGKPPERGLLVSSHVSYLDILALATARPMAFVAKAEVRHWPLLGWLTACGGTLYSVRERRTHVARLAPEFAPRVEQGVVVCLFPEGTSTNGHHVLPFRSSLLEPAIVNGWPVTPAWVGYTVEDGSVEEEVCWWRDMTFAPHFLNLLGKGRVRATVVFGEAIQPGSDRKALAQRLHAAVCELADRAGRKLDAAPAEGTGRVTPIATSARSTSPA
jgi:1-acyl-sn-glycerol-3-phosphate acyltransferase